jgi:hypothetical protein
MASKDNNGISIMVWNYHDDDLPAKASQVRINISGLASSKVLVHEYRIDKENRYGKKWVHCRIRHLNSMKLLKMQEYLRCSLLLIGPKQRME